MKKFVRVMYCLCFCTLASLFVVCPSYSAHNYIVLDDVVFVRSDPRTSLPLEKMTIPQLQDEFLRTETFPPHFFYGQMVRGELEPGVPDAIRIYALFEGKAVTGYIDKKKLWQEPAVKAPEAPSGLILRDLDVFLLPDGSTRKVLSLYQGEVVQTIGMLHYQGGSWIKVQFNKRFGYIAEKNIRPLLAAHLDESSLAEQEIPKAGRNLNRVLSDQERSGLAKTGFFLEPAYLPGSNLNVDDMADLYQRVQSAVFLTSDLYLHSFHLIFDRMLQNVEYEKLYPEIVSLTSRLVVEAGKELKAYNGTHEKVRRALTYNLLYFSVAAKLLDPGFLPPPEVRADTEAIAARIAAASGSMPQLQTGIDPGTEDFSLYQVRGHYEAQPKKPESEWGMESRSRDPERLSRYFRAMMWYGRRPFLLRDDIKTLSAIFIVKALEQTGEIKRWERIDDVLRKLIGNTDDPSPRDYRNVIGQTFGTGSPAPDTLGKDASLLTKFRENAKKSIKAPRVVDSPAQGDKGELILGFRFLGMRFTWDAHLFNQLTHSGVPGRNLPTSLDAMAIFGSSAAEELMRIALEKESWKSTYYVQQQKLKQAALGEIGKRETTYDSWLYTFSALFLPHESRQFFARTTEWQYKNLNSALGSWTELKHDTILYSKQSGAEWGEGPEFAVPPYDPPSLKGYVEPNPLFFSRLSELSSSLLKDLERSNFLTDEYKDKLEKFESMTGQAMLIAKKEVDGTPITEREYAWIRHAPHDFNRGLLLPRNVGDIVDPDILKMAVVADVATDFLSGTVLEVGVGAPQKISVVVKDLSGGTRLTTGYGYSWYEFTDRKRWTDSEWKKVVYDRDQTRINSMRPAWYTRFQKPQ